MVQANEHSTSEDGEPSVVVDPVAVAKERTDQIHSEIKKNPFTYYFVH